MPKDAVDRGNADRLSGGRKRIVVLGATGVIGSAVVAALQASCEVVRAARHGGDLQVDASEPRSVEAFFAALGPYDGLVSAIGRVALGGIVRLTPEALLASFQRKVVAQFNLLQIGLPSMRDGGSFTLSSGFLNKEPMAGYPAVAMTNGAIDGLCYAAALELPRGIRINCVSPLFVAESLLAAGVRDHAPFPTMSAAATALAYAVAVHGDFTGRNLDPRSIADNRIAAADRALR